MKGLIYSWVFMLMIQSMMSDTYIVSSPPGLQNQISLELRADTILLQKEKQKQLVQVINT